MRPKAGRSRSGSCGVFRGLGWAVVLLAAASASAATFRFEAETDFTHWTGRATPDGWSADPGLDTATYLLIGPGTTLVHRGSGLAMVRAKTTVPTGPNDRLMRLEVIDLSNGATIASRDVNRQEFPGTDVYRTFLLPFYHSAASHPLDFRVFFFAVAPITVDRIDAETDDRPLSRYGVNVHVPDAQLVDLSAAAQLRGLRMDFNWLWIEPAKGSYDFSAYDAAVDAARSHGQDVLATLAFTPDWATSGVTLTDPPDDIGDWYNFVYATVDHFHGRVRYWEIWNEPDVTRFWTGTRGDYINMVTIAAQAIRAADPDSFVVGPSLANLTSVDWEGWMDDVLKYCRSSIDVVSHHDYDDSESEVIRLLEGPRYPWETRSVRQIMQDNGMGDTPFMLTETGWQTADVGEQGQANRIRQLFIDEAARTWWTKTFLYQLADSGTGETWGVLRDDRSTKIGYGTFWNTALDGAIEAWILAAPGPGAANPPFVLSSTWDGLPAMSFTPYAATGYGARVAGGFIAAGQREKVVTGPGPGAIYGPQVRAFDDMGQPLSKVNYFAYGTLRYGVNVALGDVDGDAMKEIVTGAGPGAVFGPHVRGWNYDGASVASIKGFSYYAYGTLRYGVDVASGSPDTDFYDEVLTGPGPSFAFGGQVRGWNYDGVSLGTMPGLSFFAFATGSYGCEVAAADLDDDGAAEIVAMPGPAPALGPLARTFHYSGSAVSTYFDVVPFTGSSYGGRGASAEIDGDGGRELLLTAGPDPAFVSPVAMIAVPPSGPIAVPGAIFFTPLPTYAYGVNVGAIRFD